MTFVIGSFTKTKAQQVPMYTQYMFNTLAINPAYAGSRNLVSATGLYRSQWSQMNGAPKTATFTIDAPLNGKKIGLGLQIMNDKIGVMNTTGLAGSYAYRLRLDPGTLSLGLQGSVSQFKVDNTSVQLDPDGTSEDPAFSNNINKTLFNFGTGVYYNSDRFYIGFSALDLLSNRLYDSGVEVQSTNRAKQAVHMFLASGYVFPLSESFNLKSSVLLKGVKGAPLEADLNATLWVNDVVAVGAQYRTNADISLLTELQVTEQIRIGYAYDYSTTSLRNYNSGSHEIMLRYEFSFDAGRTITPRYF